MLQDDDSIVAGLPGHGARRRARLADAAGLQLPLSQAAAPGVEPDDLSVWGAAWDQAQAVVLVHIVLQRCLHNSQQPVDQSELVLLGLLPAR